MTEPHHSIAADNGITRRTVIELGVAATLAAPIGATMPRDRRLHFIVGSYTAEGGGGLYPLSYDVARSGWSLGAPDPAIANASFGVYGSRHDLHYLLDERRAGTVVAYHAGDGTRIGIVSTAGADPCHVAIDAGQRRLAIANYTSGSIAVFAIDRTTGMLAGPPVIHVNKGSGPNHARQAGPHAHWVGFSPDGDWLYSVDLGTDEVLGFDQRGAGGRRITAYRAPPGTGPRHMVFHPRLPKAYLLSELAGDVTVLDGDGAGGFRARQTVGTVEPGYAGVNYPAELAINRAGDRLYVSNRGHDSIAVFAIDRDGQLRLIDQVASGGHWPRFFLLVEDAGRLLVANERSGTVQAFAIDDGGLLRATGAPVAIPGAAFIARLAG